MGLLWLGQMLAYVLLFAFTPLYSTYEEQAERLLGLSPLADQRIAGLVMMVEQTLTFGVAFVVLFRASRRRRRERTALPSIAH